MTAEPLPEPRPAGDARNFLRRRFKALPNAPTTQAIRFWYRPSVVRADRRPAADDELELAALLEARGVNDSLAASFGAQNIFDLARKLIVDPTIISRARSRAERNVLVELLAGRSRSQPVQQPSLSWQRPLRDLVVNLLRGPVNLAVLVVVLAGLFTYQGMLEGAGLPFWAAPLGAGAGVVGVGGILQVLAWRMPVALGQQSRRAVATLIRAGLLWGSFGLLGMALAVLAVGLLLGWPVRLAAELALVTWLLALLLLVAGLVTVLDHPFLASGALLLGGGVALLARALTPAASPSWPLAAGYATALLASALALSLITSRLFPGAPSRADHLLPIGGQFLYKALPYFFFGALSVLYFAIGQVAGYLAAAQDPFRATLLRDALTAANLIGIGSVAFVQGANEFALRRFWPTMQAAAARLGDSRRTLADALLRFFSRQLVLLFTLQGLVFAAVLWLLPGRWVQLGLERGVGPFDSLLVGLSVIGYSLSAIGFFGCSFLITLQHPWAASRAMVLAAGVALASGLLFAPATGYLTSALGLTLGGLVLTIAATVELRREFRRVDFTLYRTF
ncbi:MAG: hypothetical protein KatS3mg061_2894 [Dehalococcoidia bacterium]|nr:MAG: hypothetical protein KatS3mg061_2894 [Dehalococcoidia bacterium]